MVQVTDKNIANGAGSEVRSDLNAVIQALQSCNAGASEPDGVLPGEDWIDTSSTPWVVKRYDGADWIAWMEINATSNKINLINLVGGDGRDEAANIGQIQDGDFNWMGNLSGTNTLTGSVSPAIPAYKAGQIFAGRAVNPPTGAVTLNINTRGAKAVQINQAAIADSEWAAGDLLVFVYDGTQFQVVSPTRRVGLSQVNTGAAAAGTIITANGSGGAQANGKTVLDFISGLIQKPAAQDYMIVIKAPYAGTIKNTITKCVSGTATFTFKINSTALGGTANAVSSTESDQAHSTSNAFAAGDDIVITVSSVSSCVGASFTIALERAL